MKAYSQDLRARAIKLFDDGYERKHIKSILSISYDTLNNWIRRYKRTGDYSSRQHLNKGLARKFTDKEAVLTYLSEHPNALALEIRDAVAPNLPLSTFRDALVWMEITYKKENLFIQRDEIKRDKFQETLSSIEPDKLVFIDETGKDDNMTALYGYSAKGTKSYGEKNAFKNERLSTIAGYRRTTGDLIASFEYTGTANKDLFLGWFEQVLCPTLNLGDYVVLDNASIHKGYEVFDIANDFGINVLYLPPYSPDLNPIEKVWANFKNKLRRIRHLYTSFKEATTVAWNSMKTHSG